MRPRMDGCIAYDGKAKMTGGGARKNIAVVDDHPLMRSGIIDAISREPDIHVIAEGASAAEALQIAVTFRPDLMLIDVKMPGDVLSALGDISRLAPGVRCLMFTVCDEPDVVRNVLKAGAIGYVLKGTGPKELCSAVRSALSNDSSISAGLLAKLLRKGDNAENLAVAKLNAREVEVLEALARGLTNKQIAVALAMSERNVKYHITCVMQKYGVHNRVAVLLEYRRHKNAHVSVGIH